MGFPSFNAKFSCLLTHKLLTIFLLIKFRLIIAHCGNFDMDFIHFYVYIVLRSFVVFVSLTIHQYIGSGSVLMACKSGGLTIWYAICDLLLYSVGHKKIYICMYVHKYINNKYIIKSEWLFWRIDTVLSSFATAGSTELHPINTGCTTIH